MNFRKKFKGISAFAKRRKVLVAIIAMALIYSGYWAYGRLTSTAGETRYMTGKVLKGTIVVSVAGSGQVSASNQVDLKPKVSGDVISVPASAGQKIGQGQTILRVDDTDARKAVHDAEIDLAGSKLQLEKGAAQAPIDYVRKKESLAKAKDDVAKEYEDAFNTVSNSFLDLPGVMTVAQDVLYGQGVVSSNGTQWNIDAYKDLFDREDKDLIVILADTADKDYKTARNSYDKNFLDFKNVTRYSPSADIESLLFETLGTTKAIAQSLKSEVNLLDTVADIQSKKNKKALSAVTTYQASLRTELGTANSHLTSLLNEKTSLQSAKQSVVDIQRDITLLEVGNPSGNLPIDLQIAKNSISKKESDLADLRLKLADYNVRVPFSGVISKLNSKKGDAISTGTVIATILTNQKLAEITLNEVDVAKIQQGQKATITFDAIPDLGLTGEVTEIDSAGTISQGVVTYAVKIIFDTQDDRVKSGMSVSAAIITATKADVLTVPLSAVKTRGNASYVEAFNHPLGASLGNQGAPSAVSPTQRPVVLGIANDTEAEVISGLNAGDEIVTRTILATAAKTAPAPSLFGSVGGNRGGAVRNTTGR